MEEKRLRCTNGTWKCIQEGTQIVSKIWARNEQIYLCAIPISWNDIIKGEESTGCWGAVIIPYVRVIGVCAERRSSFRNDLLWTSMSASPWPWPAADCEELLSRSSCWKHTHIILRRCRQLCLCCEHFGTSSTRLVHDRRHYPSIVTRRLE